MNILYLLLCLGGYGLVMVSVFWPEELVNFRWLIGFVCGSQLMLVYRYRELQKKKRSLFVDAPLKEVVEMFGKPSDVKYCPDCLRPMPEPDVREPADAPKSLDFHCPHCGFRFARWPKELA